MRLKTEEKSMHREGAERRKTGDVLSVRRGFYFVSDERGVIFQGRKSHFIV